MASITIYGSDKMSIFCCDNRKSIYIQENGKEDPCNEIRIFVNETNISMFFAALGEIAARLAINNSEKSGKGGSN